MTNFSRSKSSRVLSVLLIFTLLSGFFATPVYAKSATANPSSSSASRQVQPPSWLLSLLKSHQNEVSNGMPMTGKGAIPMDIRLNQSVNIKSQTTSNFLYYSPSEIRSAYNATSLLNSGYTGSGVTISIVDAYGDPYIQSELNTFSAAFGIPTTTVHVVCVDGPCNYYNGIASGWNGEIALDVEWAHAMAPGATINLYIGSNASEPLYDAVAAAVAGTNGNGTYLSPSSIISMSWGSPENDIGQSGSIAPVFGENYPWLNKVFQQGTAEGITFFASTGDWGAYDQTMGQTSPYGGAIYPSTDPFVTAVGGTSLYLSTTSGYLQLPAANATSSYGYETAWSWNNYYGWGTGGGFSTFFGQPSWQSGPGVPSGGMRGVPDVSWDADPLTGVIVYVSGGFHVYGGTSVGSPSWAGSMALIDQKAGHDLGLITPAIYSILNNPTEYAKAFHDVTIGDDDPLQAGPGWDPVTGVGSPNIGELAYYLAQPSTSLRVLASSNVALGTSASYTSVQIDATVLGVTSGTGYAEITSSTGVLVANITMTYNPSTGSFTGTYAIKPTDPPGMWTATVYISSGSKSGIGSTIFSVGDGITIFASWGYFLAGETIPIAVEMTGPGSPRSIVTSGSFNATFYLGTPSGPVEGFVPLSYNGSMWVGNFAINSSRVQGAWVLSVSGTDSSGNRAAIAYSWLNVGLFAETFTALGFSTSPTYVLGESISIDSIICHIEIPYCIPIASGSYSATVWDYNTTTPQGIEIGTVPLSLVFGLYWTGVFNTTNYPAGFYRIVVTGSDGLGNSAYGETLVRVAPQSLKVLATTSKSTIINNATETVSASVTYPNGTLMTVGDVDAFTSYGFYAPMTYNAASEKFVAILPLTEVAGNVSVYVAAFDPSGNFGPSALIWFYVFSTTSTSIGCSSLNIPIVTATSVFVKCTATVTGVYPTGNMSWSYSGQGSVIFNSTSCTLSLEGQCGILIVGGALGAVTLKAGYGGDANNIPSYGTLAVTVSPVEVSCATSPVVGASTRCTATVVGSPRPTGTVAWSSDSLGKFSALTCSLKKGTCSVRYTPASAGVANISVAYNQQFGTFSLPVSQMASKMTVSCKPRSVAVGSTTTIACTAKLKGYLPTGEVTWNASSINLGNITFTSGTVCPLTSLPSYCNPVTGAGTDTEIVTVSATATGAGTVIVTAAYSGDGNNTSSSGATTLTILRARTTLSVSCTPSSVAVGSSSECTATLKGYFGSVSGEEVSWYKTTGSGGVSFGTELPAVCTLSAGGTCSITVTGTLAGKVKIEAIYFGDFSNVGSEKTAAIKIK